MVYSLNGHRLFWWTVSTSNIVKRCHFSNKWIKEKTKPKKMKLITYQFLRKGTKEVDYIITEIKPTWWGKWYLTRRRKNKDYIMMTYEKVIISTEKENWKRDIVEELVDNSEAARISTIIRLCVSSYMNSCFWSQSAILNSLLPYKFLIF